MYYAQITFAVYMRERRCIRHRATRLCTKTELRLALRGKRCLLHVAYLL